MSPSGPGTGEACSSVSQWVSSKARIQLMTYSVLHAVRAEGLRRSLSLCGRGSRQEGHCDLVRASRVQRLRVLLRDLGRRDCLHRSKPQQSSLLRKGNSRVRIGGVASASGGIGVVGSGVDHFWNLGARSRGSVNVLLLRRASPASEGKSVGVGGHEAAFSGGGHHL